MSATDKVYEFGGFSLDASGKLLSRHGAAVPLTPKTFELLLALVEGAGKLVSKDTLMRRLGHDMAVEEGNLTFTVSALRKALDDSGDPPLIETVPRRGYRFNGAVRERAGGAPPTAIQSVAILPFKPFTSSDEDLLLGIGMADAVITRLSQTGELIVRPTGAVAPFAASGKDAAEAGKLLAVDAVLDGRLQRMGEQIRLTVQLLRTVDGQVLWADRFHVAMKNLFDVQDTIAEAVGTALIAHLGEESRLQWRKRYTNNLQAYQAFLWGQHYHLRRTREDCLRGIQHFEEALRIDPSYALAHSGISDVYAWISHFYLPPLEAMPKARLAARTALGLDERLGEAHNALAAVAHWFDWDFRSARKHYRRALDLCPGDVIARMNHAIFLMQLGDRAWEAEVEAMFRFDPLSTATLCGGSVPFYYTGQYEKSATMNLSCLDAAPDFWIAELMLAWCCVEQGKLKEAIPLAERSMEHSGGSHVCQTALGYCWARLGERTRAENLMDGMQHALAAGSYSSPYYFGVIHAALGNRDEAFRYLERAVGDRAGWLVYSRVDPKLNSLRGDARFDALVRQVRLL